MPTLRFKGHPVLRVYRSRMGTWYEGDEVEVTDADADYILGSFSDLFEVVGSAPAAPAENRAVSSPKKKAAPKKAAPKKKKAAAKKPAIKKVR